MTVTPRRKLFPALIVVVLVMCRATAAWAQAPAAQAAATQVPHGQDAAPGPLPPLAPKPGQGVPPSISLSPAVVMAKGNFGQGLTQTLTMSNQTGSDFAFDLVAEDVVIQDGKRVFVPAGETENGIAASAVFSQKTVLVKAYSSTSVDVRLTLPPQTNLRAVVAMFRGTNKIPTSNTSVGMTASLGALITFNLTDNIKLQPDPVRVIPATETANMNIALWMLNAGAEPVLPEGTAVVLNASGSLVGKTTFAPQRLLPGERLEFKAEYPEQLQAGSYRALCSFQYEGKTLTAESTFQVP